jgi:hypothetical protein
MDLRFARIASMAVALLIAGASQEVLASPSQDFHVRGSAIVRGGKSLTIRGVNAMHVFGGDGADLLD